MTTSSTKDEVRRVQTTYWSTSERNLKHLLPSELPGAQEPATSVMRRVVVDKCRQGRHRAVEESMESPTTSLYGKGTTTAAELRLMRGITHKCNLESLVDLQEEQMLLGLAISEESTPHKCNSYSSSSVQESHTIPTDVRTRTSNDICSTRTTTEGQGVRSGAPSEGQRGSGHHLKDKETRKTTWRH